MLLHLPDWPVSQALALLKDQTLSCLFITLILFSTWLYYLLGLLWERQLQTVVLSIRFLPPKADASTRASFPQSLHHWSSRLPWEWKRCLSKAWLLSGEEGSPGAREKGKPSDAQGGLASGWRKGAMAIVVWLQ